MHIPLRTTTLFDLPIVCETKEKVLEFLFDQQTKHSLVIVVTPNPEQIVQIHTNKEFKKNMLAADILLPDGIGLVIASHILNFFRPVTPLPERIAGIDLVKELLEKAEQAKQTVLVIGGHGYESYFLNKEKKLFWTPGYQDITHSTEAEERELNALLEKMKPDVIFVAFGAPHQEKWLQEHRAQLEKLGVSMAMAVGGTFDVLTGELPRAPKWLQSLGGEWLFRLVQQPWRLRRQLRLVIFVKLLVQELLS